MYGYVLAALSAILIAPYLHEGSHWTIGWLGKTKPEFKYVLWIFPNGVYHGKIQTMDAEIIRASGLAPLFWVPGALLASGLFLVDQSPSSFFTAFAPIFTVLMATESDALAFREPEQFRENVMDGELPRNPLFLPNPPEWVPRF